MKLRPALVGGLLVVALLVALKLTVLSNSNSRGDGRAPGPDDGSGPAVSAMVVKAERIADRVSAVGTLLPNEQVEIRSEIAGRVVSISFEEGGRVDKGQVLVKINDSELRAQLARAESRLALATDESERQKQLFAQNLSSEREYANAVNELNVASADVALIRAQLAKMEIRAPFAGVVGLRSVSEGSFVSPSTPITTLKDISTIKIDFSVPERYVRRIAAGDDVEFRVQGSPQTYHATIYALEAGIEQATRTLGVRARARNANLELVPGAFADVVIPLVERDALMVPAFALIPELKGHSVFVYSGGKVDTRAVEIGVRTDERVEVVSGLQPGDTLITSAILQLKPGARVRLSGVD
ncbi:MAG TPA: efflux RND transporter periplasmic adaptor subunit [Candidatus Krumholzibacteria bacterium]|nr:efflux RND transporter periplasmic adaptor subunit [Candidatus Krumholzibacteria bacterium]